jgi:hypothetical protein
MKGVSIFKAQVSFRVTNTPLKKYFHNYFSYFEKYQK